MFNNIVYDKSGASGVTADGSGPAFNFKGGVLVLGAFGTFGGGTIKLQYTTDNDTTWLDLGAQSGAGATSLTAAGTCVVWLPPIRARVTMAGSTAPAANYFVGDANGGG
jgi:hypothetical protein